MHGDGVKDALKAFLWEEALIMRADCRRLDCARPAARGKVVREEERRGEERAGGCVCAREREGESARQTH